MSKNNRANKSGQGLEEIVTSGFKRWECPTIEYHDWVDDPVRPALVKNYPYQNIYGTKGRTEFCFMPQNPNDNIRIECKWQAVSGSVDEKFPYLLECMKTVEERYIIIVIGGGGAKLAAVDWLKKESAKVQNKNIRVMNVEGIMNWMQDEIQKHLKE